VQAFGYGTRLIGHTGSGPPHGTGSRSLEPAPGLSDLPTFVKEALNCKPGCSFRCRHDRTDGNRTGGLDKKVLSEKLQGKTMEQRDGTIIGAQLRGSFSL
jgi:hypothetical protein